MIDSLDDSSSCAFAVSTAARSREHAAQHRASSRAPDPAPRRARGVALARHREREAILVALAAQQHRDVGRARQQLERRLDDRLDHLGRLEPRAERLHRLVDAQCLGRLALDAAR